MTHPEKKIAKRIDTPNRCSAFTDIVYSGDTTGLPTRELVRQMHAAEHAFEPQPPTLHPFVGEMHGHTNLSDGMVDIDTYFTNLRDVAKLDFAAVSDHDHGGVGRPELWVGNPSKWDIIREKVQAYRVEGEFTTILAYEKDAYPYFNNMVIYFEDENAEMLRGVRDGEMTEEELMTLLSRKDCFFAPHDTDLLSSSADFMQIPLHLMPHYFEIISRGDATEYMGNPCGRAYAVEGGYFQDALRRGVHMCVIGGSDDHYGLNGQVADRYPNFEKYPGVTGVWARENTHAALFEAFKAGRTYAFMRGPLDGDMNGRMEIDFRVNNHWMGEKITLSPDEDVSVYWSIKTDVPLRQVTVVKNCRNYVIMPHATGFFFDYKQEEETDIYYLRVELTDGRFGWTSPVSVRRQ